mgnify:CR=1 FL=1
MTSLKTRLPFSLAHGFNPLFSGEGSVTTAASTSTRPSTSCFNPLFSGEGSVTLPGGGGAAPRRGRFIYESAVGVNYTVR